MSELNDFDFEKWFDEEVEKLDKDPEYIEIGLMTDRIIEAIDHENA